MPRPGGLTIALAGGAGSGKTTVAHALANRLGGRVAGFGDFVRRLAQEAGQLTERRDLQRFGQSRVDCDVHGFVRAFVAWAGPPPGVPLIIDGVRHATVDEALRLWANSEDRDYALVLLDAKSSLRAARRTGGNIDGIRAIDAHPVEREVTSDLPQAADAVVDASGDVGEVVARVAAALPRQWPQMG